MRKVFLVTAMAAGLGIAGAADAATVKFTGTMGLQLATLPPVLVTGSGVATVNGSGGGGHVNSLAIPESPFAVAGFLVPVTDPAAFPIQGVQVTAHNAAGTFSGGAAPGGLSGGMSISGVSKVCLFAPCGAPPPANLTVPLDVNGVGGTTTVTMLVNITVEGAPWTQATASIGTVTAMGMAHGPASGTSSTAATNGVLRLVTPVFISTNIGASAVVPAFGLFEITFLEAPEPSALLLGGAVIAGLLVLGRRRARS